MVGLKGIFAASEFILTSRVSMHICSHKYREIRVFRPAESKSRRRSRGSFFFGRYFEGYSNDAELLREFCCQGYCSLVDKVIIAYNCT